MCAAVTIIMFILCFGLGSLFGMYLLFVAVSQGLAR